MRYYGLVDEKEAYKIVDEICGVLGNGKYGTADLLLIETAKVETNLGLAKDRTILNVGVGLTQFDKIGFEDTKARSMRYDDLLKDKLKVDISKVELNYLAYSPFLAFLFTRLKYKLVREEIPEDIEGRAKYWKKYYNSELGAGTIYRYLEVNKGF